MVKPDARKSLFTVVFLSAILVFCSFHHNKVSTSASSVITWDVYGYYVYLPAVFIYHDSREYKFAAKQIDAYNVSSNLYQLNRINDKLLAPGYTMGLAVLWFPFFVIAHAFSVLTHLYPADGLSFPYQLAIIIASWFYAVTGLWFLRKALLRFFTDKIVSVTIAALVLGTNYFHYACFESGMPHALLFSVYALLFYLIVCWYEKPTTLLSIGIGSTIALACLSRPSELIIVFFFLLFGVGRLKPAKQQIAFLWHYRVQVAVIIITGLIAISPQIMYWHINLNSCFYNGYNGHTFSFLKPHFMDGLFSYRKGWLLYTPLILLALAGFLTERIRNVGLLYAVLTYFLINIFIVFSWDMWWYASSFGARAVVQSYTFLAIPLASFLVFIEGRNWFTKFFIYSIIGLCIALNQFQDWQYRHGILTPDETTKTYYWKVFGKAVIDDDQIRRFLDVEEKLPEGIAFKETLLNADRNESAIKPVLSNSYGPGVLVQVNDSSALRLSDKWIRLEDSLICNGNLFYQWHEASLVFSAERKGKSLKWISVKFQRFIKPQQWRTVRYEVKLPDLKAGDELKAFIWNQGPDTVLSHFIKMQLLEQSNP